MLGKEVKNKKMQLCFQDMHKQCFENDSILSLEQAARVVDVDLKKLKKWCMSSDGQGDDYFFQLLGYRCAMRVGKLLRNKEITENEALVLLRESGYDARSLAHFLIER